MSHEQDHYYDFGSSYFLLPIDNSFHQKCNVYEENPTRAIIFYDHFKKQNSLSDCITCNINKHRFQEDNEQLPIKFITFL